MHGMNLLDAAMITGDSLLHPINIGAVMILAPPIDSGEHFADQLYRQALAQTADANSLLRRVPHRGPRTGGWWVWRDDHDLDPRRHLLRCTLPDGSGDAELWRLIGELHAERLDLSRPLWTAFLIDGLADGRLAFYVKVHHVVVDGVAGIQTISNGLSPDPDRRDMPPFYAETSSAPTPPSDSAVDPFTSLRHLARMASSGIARLERIVESPAYTALALVTGRAIIPAVGAPFTPFNGRLGPHRGVIAASWPKSRIRAVQEITHTTAHDVTTTVVGGVLRSWLTDHGQLPRRSLVALCPITVRARSTTTDPGNRFGAWLCPIGTDIADPQERLRRVHRSMSEGKRYVSRYGSGLSMALATPSIASTIVQGVTPVGPRISTGYNLPVSSVRGPTAEMYWNGAHVEEIYPVSAVFDGQTLNATVCSYADHIGIGYAADSDVIPDLDTMVSRTGQALSELESAVGAARAPAERPGC